jgi:hypothetical protein
MVFLLFIAEITLLQFYSHNVKFMRSVFVFFIHVFFLHDAYISQG